MLSSGSQARIAAVTRAEAGEVDEYRYMLQKNLQLPKASFSGPVPSQHESSPHVRAVTLVTNAYSDEKDALVRHWVCRRLCIRTQVITAGSASRLYNGSIAELC